METEVPNYYIYRHIRNDKKFPEPFYIGKGTMNKSPKGYERRVYKRAYSKVQRTKRWKAISQKGERIDVEIIFHSSSLKEILEKEREFIRLYGRIDLKTGTLVNFTDGGEFSEGYIWTEKDHEKRKGKSSFEGKSGEDAYKSLPVFVYLDGVFIKKCVTRTQCSTEFKLSVDNLSKFLNSEYLLANRNGFVFLNNYFGQTMVKATHSSDERFPVDIFDEQNQLIANFKNPKKAYTSLGVKKNTFLDYRKSGKLYKKKYYFRSKPENKILMKEINYENVL